MAIEKLNPMMRPSKVRVAVCTDSEIFTLGVSQRPPSAEVRSELSREP